MKTRRGGVCALLLGVLIVAQVGPDLHAAGKIKGSTGGNERDAIVFDRAGAIRGWTITGPSGLYEFGGLEPGEYLMQIAGQLIPGVMVRDGETTVVDQAEQPKLAMEMELWGPPRVKFAQTFVAEGTAVTGFSFWRSSGDSKLRVSLYEDSPSGRRIAGPWTTEKSMSWICGSGLPAEEFKTEPGKRYALELEADDGRPWNHGMPRQGDVYPDGIAYYDGVPHPESDLGISISQAIPGLTVVAAAHDDQHFIAEGPGSGTCTVAGQTFVATTPNIIRAGVNCGGFEGGVGNFAFSIHEDGPGGKRIGPTCQVRMVRDWGSDALWFPDAVQVDIGRTYYLQYRMVDGGSFYGYLSSDQYRQGRAYRDGKIMPEQFDQYFSIIGEQEPESVIFPYNVRAIDVSETSATIVWETGTTGDGLVHFGTTMRMNERAGSEETRSKQHRVTLTSLKPGTVYMYRASSDTHKKSSRRTFSRIHTFLTSPGQEDVPRFDEPEGVAPEPEWFSSSLVVNGGFEHGLTGWSRRAQIGRPQDGDAYQPDAQPFGDATGGRDGYRPHSGEKLYGWSYFGPLDPTWVEPREDWKHELLYQRIPVKKGQRYALTAWLLTGDRGSGWGRDSRMALVVDEQDSGVFESFDTISQANMTQWFATQHRWLPITLEFEARADHVQIGVYFLHWWALETNRLYVDEISVRPIEADE